MMKIVGTVMISISIILFGFLRYDKYKRRPCDIEFFIKLLSAYKLELKWSQKSLDEILKSYKDQKYSDYITETINNFEAMDKVSAYTDGNDYFKRMCFSEDDRVVLQYFFCESGKGSLATELALCDKTLQLLEAKKQEAAAEFNKQGPLTLKLAVISGIWLVIMLL